MTRKAVEVLDQEFLIARAKLLELAAILDRLDRADGDLDSQPRMVQIREAVSILQGPQPNRAEQLQLHFSRPYSTTWRKDFGLASTLHPSS